MKKIVKLRENELKRMITESVKRVINEWYEPDYESSMEKHNNSQVEELIQNTLGRLPGDALHADAYVVPIIRGAIKKAYDLGCTECNVNK